MGIVRWGAPTEIIVKIKELYGIDKFVETGTYYGKTACWAASVFKQVITVENSAVIYENVKKTCGHIKNIKFVYGDSRTELDKIISEIDCPCIFWLDAHWSQGDTFGKKDECPLIKEIEIINNSKFDHVILIDDARLFEYPPPSPHNFEAWPDIYSVLSTLNSSSWKRYIVIIEDVIIAVPNSLKSGIADYYQSVSNRIWKEYNENLREAKNAKATKEQKDNKSLELKTLCHKYSIVPRGVIHIGAHEGQELEMYQSMGIQRMLLIEANPSVFEKLKAKKINASSVMAVNCAIADYNGTIILRENSHNLSSSILPLKRHKDIFPQMKEVSHITVPSRTLDSLMAELKINPYDYNIIVIDIQGAELIAFHGATKTLNNIDAILSEVNFQELYEDCALIWDIDDFLGKYDFLRMDTNTPWHPAWGDAFYMKKHIDIYPKFKPKTENITKNSDIIIVTTIAPGNTEKQRTAIESWRSMGFSVVSLNTRDDIKNLQPIYSNIVFHEVNRDAMAETGRSLIYLDDIFSYICNYGTKICGIVNSDIILKEDSRFVSFVAEKADNSMIISSRTDTDSLDFTEGNRYNLGFDIFFFDRQILKKFPSSEFFIGLPWWDLWVPFTACQKGINLNKMDSDIGFHIKHKINYSNEFWLEKGIHFAKFIRNDLASAYWNLLNSNSNLLQTELKKLSVHVLKTIENHARKISF